jgi:hypothetical protein
VRFSSRYTLSSVFDLQGGVMNHGLLFAGPPPPPLLGCEQKDQRNPLGGHELQCYCILLAANSSLKALRG